MLLVPVGIINERHEPPVFHGVERPFVDTVIVPTTWFEAGAGVHGAFGHGFRYRAYAMAPLDATEFTAEEGLRGGAQQGSEAQVRNVALTGRLEYVGMRGLQTGVSFWRGDTGFNVPRIDTTVGLYEFDARFHAGGSRRAVSSRTCSSTAPGALNDAMGRLTGIDPNVAEQLRGFYVEVAYRVLPASVAPRRGRVRPLRELRHAVQDARRVRSSCRSSIATRGSWARPTGSIPMWPSSSTTRTCGTRATSCRRRARSTSAWAGGSRRSSSHGSETRRSLCGALVVLAIASCAARRPAGSGATARVIHIAAERFAFTPSEITRRGGEHGGAPPDERRHRSTASGSSDRAIVNVAIPEARARRRAGDASTRTRRAATRSSARRSAAPATGSCAAPSA